MTVREQLAVGSRLLAIGRPQAQANLEAQLLLAQALCQPRIWLFSHPDTEVPSEAASAYAASLQRRSAGEPLEYILGRSEFYGLSLEVTPATLVPRPETEVLVEVALIELAGKTRPLVADVGTGSGAIALAIASNHPTAQLLATDISFAALALARRNVHALSQQHRIWLVCCHLLACANTQFDLIVANLPYVTSHELSGSAALVAQFEPRVALDGGPDGTALIAELLAMARASLVPGGTILAEIGATQREKALCLAQEHFPEAQASIMPDLAGWDRLLRIRTSA
ncbi:MAG: peptide chain release factor N(5)-glutamine methyltransferase [Anaerolineae bacterium]